jgi:uncharacterized membrane protein YkoI
MRKSIALAAVLLVALFAQVDGWARSHDHDDGDHDRARRAFERGEVLPIMRILALVTRYLPGDIIEVKLDRRHGRFTYEVKVLTPAGRVRELVLDASTGAFVTIED